MNPWKGRLMVTVFLLLISINADASETPKSPAGFQRYYEKVRSHYPVLKR